MKISLPPALLFDLDNTLAESKQPISRATADLLAKITQHTRIAILSGGMLSQLQHQVTDELPPSAVLENVYLLPTSGGALYTYADHEWTMVYEEVLTTEEADTIEAGLEGALESSQVIDLSMPVLGPRIEQRGPQVTLSVLGQRATLEAKRAWDPDGSKRDVLRSAVQKILPEYEVRKGGSTSIDVTKRGVNKAYGVRQLARYLEVSPEDFFYFGDELSAGGNDAVVKETGITTVAVNGPEETREHLQQLLTPPAPKPVVPMPPARTVSPLSSALLQVLQSTIKGDVSDAADERAKYDHDTSLFRRTPSVVVYPKDAADVSALVKIVRNAKEGGTNISVTGRSAGTDMSGGPLTTSVVAVFMKYMNRIISVTENADGSGGYAVTEPGVFYRDFERETLAHGNLLMPSYPASRELCAMGGIVNNDSGGERTLEYGKTNSYVEEVDAVLSDGSFATFKALTKAELAQKKEQQNLEGEIYRRMDLLLTQNQNTIADAKPRVSKNSAGYQLWNVIDPVKETFNLAKLICGAQGTLALMTSAKLRLVREETHRSMLVIFLQDLAVLPEIVRRVLPFNPESFESYDDQTFKLAVKFMPQMLSQMGFGRATRLGISFLPEVGMVLSGGIPKLVLMAEFAADTAEVALKHATDAEASLAGLHLSTSIKHNERESEKYWIVRRESFALLRKNVHGLYASPFIDDFVVPPDTYPQFLPELNVLLAEYSKNFIYTIAGHIGNGNFHIIPLMDLSKPEVRQTILELAPKVYALVIKYGGTTTGEHNDGIIRTPYLPMLFGPRMMKLFEETKKIFDPAGIFNPGKKVGGTFADIERDMLRTSGN